MIINKIQQIERHSNGVLAYHCTWAEISIKHLENYPNCIVDKTGRHFIRIGYHRKYFDNMQLAWQLKYDKYGNSIKDVIKSYRKDGTNVVW